MLKSKWRQYQILNWQEIPDLKRSDKLNEYIYAKYMKFSGKNWIEEWDKKQIEDINKRLRWRETIS